MREKRELRAYNRIGGFVDTLYRDTYRAVCYDFG
jgi:hypothetical protein